MATISRRQLLCAASLATLTWAPGKAMVQTYPSKPVKIIVPFAPGGPTDTSARIMAQALGAAMSASFNVENVPGAGGVIGTTRVAGAEPDGYTFLWGTPSSLTIAPAVRTDLRYDPNTSFAPVSLVVSAPFVLVVRPALGVSDVAGLVAYAKANPGKLNYGSTGLAGSAHMITELFLRTMGIEATHIPFQGGAPMVMALRQGSIDLLFDTPTTVVPLIQGNAGTPLAVTSAARARELPNVVTLQEAGLRDFDVVTWFGMLAPQGSPPRIVNLLSERIAGALRNESLRSRLMGAGLTPVGSSPAEFSARIRSEGQRWAEVARAAGIKVQ